MKIGTVGKRSRERMIPEILRKRDGSQARGPLTVPWEWSIKLPHGIQYTTYTLLGGVVDNCETKMRWQVNNSALSRWERIPVILKCSVLKYVFIEASWTAIRSSPYCRAYFERMKHRKGSNVAIVALARRLSEIAYRCIKGERTLWRMSLQAVCAVNISLVALRNS